MRIEASGADKTFPAGDRVIALLMSGGVDSSVAALLLRREGWNVVGFTMCIPDIRGRLVETGESAACVAAELEIPHFLLHAEKDFEAKVIAPFLDAYSRGRTPNPCADCNRAIKFGLLMDAIDDFAGRTVPVATGHYARILRGDEACYLVRGVTEAKDQSYFLCDLPRERLCRLYFPLEEYSKDRVREVAREAGMTVADRADSMEICFVAGEDYRDRLPSGTPGDIVDKEGNVLGRHAGIGGYTVGQRKGMGIAAPRPLYVLKIDAARNEIVAGDREEAFVREVAARRPNVLAPDRTNVPLFGKTRSRSSLSPCRILHLDEESLSVAFDVLQFAPAAGQRLVLYDGEGILVVSGVIV